MNPIHIFLGLLAFLFGASKIQVAGSFAGHMYHCTLLTAIAAFLALAVFSGFMIVVRSLFRVYA